MPRKQRQEEIFVEVLLKSNLLEVAADLADQIMEPVEEYFDSGGDSSVLGGANKTYKPKERFDMEKCLGKYEMTVAYMSSNKGTFVHDAREHDMTLKLVNPSSREGQRANFDREQAKLRVEVVDLIEHEMGHYYLGEMAGAGDCIYYTDPKGFAVYFEDPQEIVLHSKVIWNRLKRRWDFGEKYLDYTEKHGEQAFDKFVNRIVGDAVAKLEHEVGVPGAKFPKRVQKRYVDHIMKYYVNPVVEKAKKKIVASDLVRMAKELIAKKLPDGLTLEVHSKGRWFEVEAKIDGEVVGSVSAEERKYGYRKVMAVFDSKVDSSVRRQGVGTALYKKAWEESSRRNRDFASDNTVRTKNADMLWRSLGGNFEQFYDSEWEEDSEYYYLGAR